jgi:hypothetical protein
LWFLYLAFQFLGILAGIVLWFRVRRGLMLSILFHSLQVFWLQTSSDAFVLSSGLNLTVSWLWLSNPTDITSPPSLVLGVNLLSLALVIYLAWYLKWKLKALIRQEREARTG